MKHNAITCALIVGTVLVGFSSSSWSRDTGATTSRTNYNVEAWSDSEARSFYWLGNRNDGTKWEWKWDKTYNKFTSYCSATACPISANETITETVAWMIGTQVAGANAITGTPIGALTSTLTPVFQRTFTTAQAFGFSWGVTLSNGQNGYGGVIALVRQQNNANIRGRWNRTGCTTRTYPKGGSSTTCNYRWDNDQISGNWTGTYKAQHRTFLCATTQTITPTVGALLPSGCSKPQLPSGWYGG
jgi:hypothetical protein